MLYDGTPMSGPAGLREALLKHQDAFLLSFTEHLMTYALGRRIEAFDMAAVRKVIRDAGAAGLEALGVRPRRGQLAGIPDEPGGSRSRRPSRDRGPGTRDRGKRAEQCIITKKHLSRRTALKGLGVTIGLPFLEAMVPARTALAKTAATRIRLAAIEMVHGSAGATVIGLQKNMWSPATVGADFDLSPTSLMPLSALKEHLTIVSNTDVRNAEAFELPEIGGDHFRSSAVYLTQSHPKQTQGSDVLSGTSLDQFYAKKVGHETPIPSMQLCIESIDQAGGCAYGYSCVYTDTISWASPSEPLPMIRDPRAAFDQLFGVGATPAERASRRQRDKSILDFITAEVARLRQDLGPADRARLGEYLDDVREIERRIQKVELSNSSGEPRELPGAPVGVPDAFAEHVRLMFDLQAVAFASDITRVFSFKMGRDGSSRAYPESGTNAGFHPASHHQDREDRIREFQKINTYHIAQLPYFLDKLKNTPDGDGTLLDNTLVIYGSPMGNSNVHNHKRCPLFFAGHAGGQLKGGLHIKTADGTPMANPLLGAMHLLGLNDVATFGDSTGALDLNAAPDTTALFKISTRSRRMRLRQAGGRDGGRARRPGARRGGGGAVGARRWPTRRWRAIGPRSARCCSRARDVNAAQGDGMTALHWAAMKNDAELAQMLVYAGANVKATTRLGANTPLVIAARNGSAGGGGRAAQGRRRCQEPDLHRHHAADARRRLRQRRGGEGADRRRVPTWTRASSRCSRRR